MLAPFCVPSNDVASRIRPRRGENKMHVENVAHPKHVLHEE